MTGDEAGNMIVAGDDETTFLYSPDGLEWHESNTMGEAYQPCIYNAQFYCAKEVGKDENKLFVSKDFGRSWEFVKDLSEIGWTTGMVASNNCALFTQTLSGVFRSTDAGHTWSALGDFSSFFDVRFHLARNVLFVAQQYTGLDTGNAGSVWRYVELHDLTIAQTFDLNGCEIDTSIVLNYNADCFEGELISAEIVQPGTRFTLGNITLPQAVSGDFAIPFSYSSLTNDATDEATLKIRFRAGAYTFDTTIAIIAKSGPKAAQIGFTVKATNQSPGHGERTTLCIYPSIAASNVELHEVSFDLSYLDDLFRVEDVRSSYQIGAGARANSGRMVSIPLTISADDITLDPNVPIAEIDLLAMLTDTTTTDVTISNVKLNGGDQDYARCKLALTESEGTALSVQLRCGDPLMQRVMRGEKALEIKSITPNPTDDQVTIEWDARVAGDVKLEVYSMAGVLVHEENVALASAGKPFSLDTRTWPSGAYTIRLTSGEEEATASVIKQ